MENRMIHEKLDLSKETSEARLWVGAAVGVWIVSPIIFLIGQYAPLGKFATGVLIISGMGFLVAVCNTARAIFHGLTVLVMRVSAVWRNPVQIAIALLAPTILSLYFLRDGLPKWSFIEDMLIWSNCIPLLLIAFVSLKCSVMLDKVVPMRGFLISASALFILCFLYSMGYTTGEGSDGESSSFIDTKLASQSGWKASFFVVYLVYVAVSYGAMCFHLFKRTRGNHRRGTQLSLWD